MSTEEKEVIKEDLHPESETPQETITARKQREEEAKRKAYISYLKKINDELEVEVKHLDLVVRKYMLQGKLAEINEAMLKAKEDENKNESGIILPPSGIATV